MFINLHLLNEPLYDFFVRVVVVLNVFVQLLAQRQVFGLQLLFGFPPGMRMDPVLNALDLITGSQVNEFLDIGTVVVLDPLVRLDVHGFALGVRAMNGALVQGVVDAVIDAVVAVLFIFLMLLMRVSSISRSISISGFKAVAFCAHFCSWYHKLFRASYPFPQCAHANAFFGHSMLDGLHLHFFS